MKCDAPTIAFRLPGINPATGKHYPPISFRQFSKVFEGSSLPRHERERIMVDYYHSCPDGYEPVLMPCKRCMLCSRAYRRMWAYRLCCEARSASESMFITLTVDDQNLNTVFPCSSLVHKPFQDFMKRMRICFSRGFYYDKLPPFVSSDLFGKLPTMPERVFYKRQKIKFYMCGEYGDTSLRPHYHVCVFGARFPDAYFAKKVGNSYYYTSPTLLKLWPYGKMSLFSDVTPSSAAYVAGYVDKKLERDQEWFKSRGLAPEYVRMSNGIGRDFFDAHVDEIFRFTSDGESFGEFNFLGDFPVPTPVYFDEKFALRSPAKYDKLLSSRESRRLARQRLMPVDELFNESGRKNAVLLARRKVREIRE